MIKQEVINTHKYMYKATINSSERTIAITFLNGSIHKVIMPFDNTYMCYKEYWQICADINDEIERLVNEEQT